MVPRTGAPCLIFVIYKLFNTIARFCSEKGGLPDVGEFKTRFTPILRLLFDSFIIIMKRIKVTYKKHKFCVFNLIAKRTINVTSRDFSNFYTSVNKYLIKKRKNETIIFYVRKS